ncbi:DegT/DnrJ/EryC1/StrS family aminotransferase [Candidatus Marinimicrobia bacterium]|nr:DegT/DnrJ/EryC1/StrS family aminotransferase [Candidatus Neomarinimicrobiota bacterium]
MKNKNIYVTKPTLAPFSEYTNILRTGWESGVLTHNGPLVQKLEKNINDFLGINSTVAVTNGTIALQIAIKALSLKGEIITSPFSWIASIAAIQWEGCKPTYVDADIDTFNLDVSKIEDAITENTCAIMPVHVFSNPCDIEKIDKIAKKYNLKVIYDAAHAFGVKFNGNSIFNAGDISCTSLHATKIFNSGEGGACFSTNSSLTERMKKLRFFGHDNNGQIVDKGINGKLTEVHSAIGLANLPYVKKTINRRKEIFSKYHSQLSKNDDIRFQSFNVDEYNYSYMPIVFSDESQLIKIVKKLNDECIYPRRYFYPSLNTVTTIQKYQEMKNSELLSKNILCLPSYTGLEDKDIELISSIILKNI